MRSGAARAHDDADRALAARFDVAAGGFAEDRDVGPQPVGQVALDAAEAVGARLDFLAVVHHQRDVVGRLGDRRGEVQEHRVAGLHVRGAAAVQFVSLGPETSLLGRLSAAGTVSVWPASRTRDGRPRLVRASTAVPVADDLEAGGLLAQRRLDLVGDALLVPRLAGDVDECRGQRDRISTQVQAHDHRG